MSHTRDVGRLGELRLQSWHPLVGKGISSLNQASAHLCKGFKNKGGSGMCTAHGGKLEEEQPVPGASWSTRYWGGGIQKHENQKVFLEQIKQNFMR